MSVAHPVSAWLRALPRHSGDPGDRTRRLNLIGIDMAPTRGPERNQTLVPVIAAIVVAALLMVGLRMDVVRMRYASAQAVNVERALLNEKRSATVRLLRLRKPKLLSERAAKLGFAKPDRVITLSTSFDLDAPSVGTGPRP